MAKTILFDLETSRTAVEGYGSRWDFKVVKFTKQSELMCYSWKELGSKKVNFVSRHDFNNYHDFVKSLRDLLDSADITIAHNGGNFDNKVANKFFLLEGIEPPRPRKSIDTLLEARKWFKFESNKLDDLGQFLGLGRKESIGYMDLEDDFMSDWADKKTINLMRDYNNQDVKLLEAIYLKMRPFMQNHPNLGDMEQIDGVCPKCLSADLKLEGTHARRNGRVQSFSCNNCGGWCNDNSIVRPNGRKVNGA